MADERGAALPLGRRAPARRPGVRGRRRRRPRCPRPQDGADLLAALPLQGGPSDDLVGAQHRPVRRQHLRRHRPTAAASRRSRSSAPARSPTPSTRTPSHLPAVHPDRRRPQRPDAGQRQHGSPRVLHALDRQQCRRAVGLGDGAVPGALRGRRGPVGADQPHRVRRHRHGEPELDRRAPTTSASPATTSTARPPPGSHRVRPTRIGSTTTPSYTDAGVPAGTYFYVVRANDSVGNVQRAVERGERDGAGRRHPPVSADRTHGHRAAGSTGEPGLDRVHPTTLGSPVTTSSVTVSPSRRRPGTSYVDTTVQPSTTYTYTVTAQDAAGNVSGPSNSGMVTTPAQATADQRRQDRQLPPDRAAGTHRGRGSHDDRAPTSCWSRSSPLTDHRRVPRRFSGVSGGGLTWRLRQRTNTQAGTSEIWTAVAAAPLSNATITATRSSGSWVGSITVVGLQQRQRRRRRSRHRERQHRLAERVAHHHRALDPGCGPSATTGIGQWPGPSGPGQTKVDEFLATVGDTFWVQSQTAPGGAAGSLVTLNDTSPTTDRWNFSAIEILPR